MRSRNFKKYTRLPGLIVVTRLSDIALFLGTLYVGCDCL